MPWRKLSLYRYTSLGKPVGVISREKVTLGSAGRESSPEALFAVSWPFRRQNHEKIAFYSFSNYLVCGVL